MTYSKTPPKIVIDASIAFKTLLPFQQSSLTAQRFGSWMEEGYRMVVPDLWLPEVISGIRKYVFTGELTIDEGQAIIEDVLNLGIDTIHTDAKICRSAFQWAGRLGQARVYDGFYLALSELYEMPLWSADRRLVNRAKLSGADWVHWSEEPLHQPA